MIEQSESMSGAGEAGANLSDLLGAVCEHGQLKRSCQICDKDDTIQRLRGQLQNCVDHLHYFKRRGYGDKVDAVIDRANKVLYETLGT